MASMAALANAHGYFTSPAGRVPGALFQSECGMQAYYQMSGDINGNIQGLQQTTKGQADYTAACRLWMCKGMKYADNTANVQKYTAGQTVPLVFDIRAPHTGVANVSIVHTANNNLIAKNLKTWTNYASNSVPAIASQSSFSIKMPTNLGSKCAKAGDCVIQMYWDAASVDQTYESCIDFSMPAAASKRGLDGGMEDVVARPHARDFSPREGSE
ncbi:hypothetical protein LTR08_002424 [Meristemomyces frigidus]|nr:hypothetical protein LTR08_002424 [Meristemomyces frigidus]